MCDIMWDIICSSIAIMRWCIWPRCSTSVATMLAIASTFASPCAACIAEILVALGEFDEAFRWLDARIWYDDDQGGGYMPKIDPLYDPIRTDPRFVTFLQEAGLE